MRTVPRDQKAVLLLGCHLVLCLSAVTPLVFTWQAQDTAGDTRKKTNLGSGLYRHVHREHHTASMAEFAKEQLRQDKMAHVLCNVARWFSFGFEDSTLRPRGARLTLMPHAI